jgi:putative membrane protein
MQQTRPDFRMIFSAERTMLAWIRTGLALMGFGFVVAQFHLFLIETRSDEMIKVPNASLWFGFFLVLLGVLINITAGMTYAKNVNRILANEALQVKRWPLGRVLSVIMAIIGSMMAGYLILMQ